VKIYYSLGSKLSWLFVVFNVGPDFGSGLLTMREPTLVWKTSHHNMLEGRTRAFSFFAIEMRHGVLCWKKTECKCLGARAAGEDAILIDICFLNSSSLSIGSKLFSLLGLSNELT
jgi:hypothetical protein